MSVPEDTTELSLTSAQKKLDWPLHLTAGLGVGFCLAAFVFEALRAAGGNGLSWLYVFEWPILAGFGIYMWWKIGHGGDRTGQRTRTTRADAEASPEELAAWRAYQASLDAADAKLAAANDESPEPRR